MYVEKCVQFPFIRERSYTSLTRPSSKLLLSTAECKKSQSKGTEWKQRSGELTGEWLTVGSVKGQESGKRGGASTHLRPPQHVAHQRKRENREWGRVRLSGEQHIGPYTS